MKKILLSSLFVVSFCIVALTQNPLDKYDVLLSPNGTVPRYDIKKRVWDINGYKISMDSMLLPEADDWRFITNLMLLEGEECVTGLMNDSLMRVFRSEKLKDGGYDLYRLYVDLEWDDGVLFTVPKDSQKPVSFKRLKFNGVVNPQKK